MQYHSRFTPSQAFFKYPMQGLLGIYATTAFLNIQDDLRDFKWTYLLVGSQYLAQRWREVNLANDIRRLQFYISAKVGKGEKTPRTAMRALHATYKRIRKVYATRPIEQRVQILQHWCAAVRPALAQRYLSEKNDCKYKGPLSVCLKEAQRAIDNYYSSQPKSPIPVSDPEQQPQAIEPVYSASRKYSMDFTRFEPRNPYEWTTDRT